MRTWMTPAGGPFRRAESSSKSSIELAAPARLTRLRHNGQQRWSTLHRTKPTASTNPGTLGTRERKKRSLCMIDAWVDWSPRSHPPPFDANAAAPINHCDTRYSVRQLRLLG